ncbi:MAG: hypothetical protein ACTHN0_11950, partial [Aquihabitans sp.]
EYLVGTKALRGIGATRPPDSMVIIRDRPLTEAERSTIARLERTHVEVLPDPTLAEIKRAFAVKDAGSDTTDGGVYLESDDRFAVIRPSWDLTQWNRALAAATGLSLVLALLVLTITLSLRAVDAEPDQRAALAAGVAPSALRHQRAYEGVVLSLLGAALALPLGWLPVQAARLGVNTAVPHEIGGVDVMLSFSSPGWVAIPVLLAPALVAALLWTVVPAIAARLRDARHPGPIDLVAPRW